MAEELREDIQSRADNARSSKAFLVKLRRRLERAFDGQKVCAQQLITHDRHRRHVVGALANSYHVLPRTGAARFPA
jgi:hypothetical protein